MCTDSAAYGTLPSSAALAQAVDTLNSTMHTELDAAESKLDQVGRSLDAVVRSIQNTESNSVHSLSVR